MKSLLWMTQLFLMLVCSVNAEDRKGQMGSHEYAVAVRYGAKALITLKVVDDAGNIVPEVNIKVSFARPDSKWIDGIADTNGLYMVKGKASGKILYELEKAGYYLTSAEYSFPGEDKILTADGRWLPWGSTNTVIIKKIRNPVTMYADYGEYVIPLKGTNVAFDLEQGDWVAPYGKGKYSDLIVNCDEQAQDPWTGFRKLELTFGTNTLDGVCRFKLDNYSMFRTIYEAPEHGYEKGLTWSLDRTKDRMDVNEPPPDEYFVFRVRTEVDDKGKIVKANYGKIYGPIRYGNLGGRLILKMIYYFNPEVNSRNLEFDPNKNLSQQDVSLP